MQDRVKKNPKIEILWNHNTKEIVGTSMGFNKSVNGAILVNNKTNEEKRINIDGFFVAIGHTPNSGIFKGQLDMDEVGYIQTIPGSTRTNIPGVFAAGDVQDKIFRQAITAAGSGCMAAIEAERFLGEHE
jgi:thioredoxin reductase (NADPH)